MLRNITFSSRSFLSISALLLIATLFCACNKDPRYVLSSVMSTNEMANGGTFVSKLFITDRKGNKRDITPQLPDGFFLDDAEFANGNPRLIWLYASKYSDGSRSISSLQYAQFSMDLNGKNLRRLDEGATDIR